LSIVKIKEVLRLHSLGLKQRQIARSCSISPSTVSDYLQAAAKAELSWPAVEGWDDDKLELTLWGDRPKPTPRRQHPAPDFAVIHQELQSHSHLTLQLIWEEYRVAQPEGYRYSRFCDLYREWLHKRDVVLRQQHRAGEKLFVDYARIRRSQRGNPCENRQQVYGWVERVLVQQAYRQQGKAWRGLLRHYIEKMTCLSRAQVTRLIARYAACGRVVATVYRRRRFPQRYTQADAELLASVDEAHETLSGPATRHILERELQQYGNQEYARLATISVGHLYNLRHSRRYLLAQANNDLPLAEQKARKALEILDSETAGTTVAEANARSFERNHLLIATWDTLGFILFKENKLDEACDFLEAAWRNRPARESGEHYALTQEALGEKKAALHTYELVQSLHASANSSSTQQVSASIERLKKAGVGSTINANAMWGLQQERTYKVKLNSPCHSYCYAIFRLQLASESPFTVMRVSGESALQPATSSIKQLVLPHLVPTHSAAHVLRDAVLNCQAGSNTCDFVLVIVEPGMALVPS
jgi:DNA-directed RNA polymerase specialized sigma24 family protein